MNAIQKEALALHRFGWNPVAAAPRGKIPIGAWKRYQGERIPPRLMLDGFALENCNLFIITGSVSQLTVLDCDDEAALTYWTERIGADTLQATTRVATANGYHFYFRLAKGQVERGRSSPGGDSGKWDLRAEGGGVIAPPSIHPTGRKYEWVAGHGPEALQDAPAELWNRRAEGDDGGEAPRSMLSHLLSNVPAEGGRNMWLTKVAGHYAKHIPHEDAFEAMVRDAAEKLTPALPEEEIAKMVQSIWTSEQAKVGRAVEPVQEEDQWRALLAEPALETGWLVSGGTRILVQTRKKEEDQWAFGLAMWMDADIRVIGVITHEDQRVYEIELRKVNGEVISTALPAATVNSSQLLPIWLGGHGVSIGVPDEMWPVKMREGARLTRYLEAQNAPAMEAVPHLGWHDESGAFITHDGIIRADGASAFEAVRPNPTMRNWAKYRYGTEAGEDVAREVLSRVLEFHDETVAAVFGSWWAAALLKPQIQRAVSQFPFMALEAASESGKTTGYFNLMMQLSGHYGGQSNPTPAALRDALSANRSGIVWVDDLDDLAHHGELLRNVTVGGSLVKKGEDNSRQITAVMRAALVVSGEGLGLHGQKALLDRAILLSVPSPVGRVSRDGRPQWEDILELGREHPDLTDLAGNVVQLALKETEQIKAISKLRVGSGRFADKNAIIRLGARILAAMLQENWVVEVADDWALSQIGTGNENALTLSIIPEVLALTGYKQKPEGPDETRRMVATPAFVEKDGKDTVWFSPMLLEQWLQRNRRRSSARLETRQALEDQARALGLGGTKGYHRKGFRFSTGNGQAIYWRCTDELSEVLMDRSQGQHANEAGGEEDGHEDGKLL